MNAGRLLYRILDRPPDTERIHKILVIQFGGIGDVIRIFPAMSALRRRFPNATVSVVTEYDDRIFDLFSEKSSVADFIQLDSRNRHRSLFSKLALIMRLRQRGFDLIYQPGYGYGMMECSVISFLIGAPCRIGFMKDGAGFLNTFKRELQSDLSILEQQMSLLSDAGMGTIPERFDYHLHIGKKDREYGAQLYREHFPATHGPIVTIHPGANWVTKGRCWSSERYSELIDILVERHKAAVIILGSRTETGIAEKIKMASGGRAITAAGLTTLGQTAALIASSDIFIGNDSGLLHIAIGFAVPSVGIFGFTSSRQVIHPNSSCTAVEKTLPCRPCYRHQALFTFTCDDPECLNSITVNDVLDEVEKKLAAHRASGAIPDDVHVQAQICGGRQ